MTCVECNGCLCSLSLFCLSSFSAKCYTPLKVPIYKILFLIEVLEIDMPGGGRAFKQCLIQNSQRADKRKGCYYFP